MRRFCFRCTQQEKMKKKLTLFDVAIGERRNCTDGLMDVNKMVQSGCHFVVIRVCTTTIKMNKKSYRHAS